MIDSIISHLNIALPSLKIGYISLWTQLGNEISKTNSNRLKDHYTVPDADIRSTSDGYLPVTVCIGGEWYTFPSHFFLPPNARLEYVRGNFHGQLPQHFRSYLGTSNPPIYNFNDKNEEEDSRYVEFNTCDYLVASIKPPSRYQKNEVEASNENENKISWFEMINDVYQKVMKKKIDHENVNENENENNGGIEKGRVFDFQDSHVVGKTFFSLLFSRKIIDPSESYSAIARAYFIPGFSGMKNAYNSYSALKKTN